MPPPPENVARYEGRCRQGWDAIRCARHETMLGRGILDRQWRLSKRHGDAPAWEDAGDRDWSRLRLEVARAWGSDSV